MFNMTGCVIKLQEYKFRLNVTFTTYALIEGMKMASAHWPYIFRCLAKAWFSLAHKYKHKHIRTRRMAYLTQLSIPLSFPQLGDKQDGGYCLWYVRMRSGSKWPMIGPWPCAYASAYVDPVFTSQSHDISISISIRKTNLSVFLVLMLMLMRTRFSLAYTCACAYAYALVKTRLNQHEGIEFRGLLPMVSFTRRLRSKWVHFSGFRHIKGYGLLRVKVYERVKKICHRPTLYVITNYSSFILFQRFGKGTQSLCSRHVKGVLFLNWGYMKELRSKIPKVKKGKGFWKSERSHPINPPYERLLSSPLEWSSKTTIINVRKKIPCISWCRRMSYL